MPHSTRDDDILARLASRDATGQAFLGAHHLAAAPMLEQLIRRAQLAPRVPAGVQLPEPVPCPEAEELAWLFGRMAVPGLPVLGPGYWTSSHTPPVSVCISSS